MPSRLTRGNDSGSEHITRFDYSAVWFLVFGAIAGSFGGIFVKIAEESLSPGATIFNRFFIASIILITIRMPRFSTSIKNDALKIFSSKAQDVETILLFLLCGLSGSLMHYAYCLSVAKSGIAVSDLLLSMSPIVTAFLLFTF